MARTRVLIYNEYYHERIEESARRYYPEGIHKAIAEELMKIDKDLEISFATLDDHKEVITAEKLENTDVLLWWGHVRHGDVDDHVVSLVCEAVNKGMGLLVLHSGHESKVFQKLMGTRCGVGWYENGDHARIWFVDPTHPIVQGVANPLELEAEETYCEPFSVPAPDELIGITWWPGGQIFRGMSVYHRGYGKIFYFHPGHETCPSYRNPNVIKVIDNGIHYVCPTQRLSELSSYHLEPIEK